ncbi:MAG: 50S ribosomal protein L10 [Desulfobacteraceae bacterium]|nr:50S ribosomal protein L10 [Desulfobacteraceae bacterium]
MNREEKASVVQELSDKIARAKIAIVTDYRGLTVNKMQDLRRQLKQSNAEIKVAKNTLLSRAVQGTPFEVIQEQLQGTTALTVSYADPVSSAKIVTEFAKENPQLVIRSAALGGKRLTSEDLVALSKLPSKEILLGQMLSVMLAVPTGFVRALNGVPQKMVYLLQALKDQKGQAQA